MTWFLLLSAAVLEAVWALALKASEGFTKPLPSIVFALAAVASVVLLALALRDLPVGTAYAVWTGAGAVMAALAGMIVLGEPATAQRLAAVATVAGGVAWLALGEHAG